MMRRAGLLPLIFVLLVPACRERSEPEEGTVPGETDTVAAGGIVAPPPPALRARLDEIQPAIPIYPGAEEQRQNGDSFDLVTNDPFPMVWHYYVTYLAQFRAWDHPAPYPSRNESARRLVIPLNEAMKQPFIPGSAIPDGSPSVMLELREMPSGAGTSIRYAIRNREPIPDADEAGDDAARTTTTAD
ncbi:MAG: hypothetical protein KY459_05410 [Acidobacteria bacterium]|nr:hypothetical protein [Acidobacteriota bacterium]